MKRELLFFFAVGFVLYAALILLWAFSPASSREISKTEEKIVAEQSAISRLAFFFSAFNR